MPQAPVFRPVTNNRTGELDRPLDPALVYCNIVRKYELKTDKLVEVVDHAPVEAVELGLSLLL